MNSGSSRLRGLHFGSRSTTRRPRNDRHPPGRPTRLRSFSSAFYRSSARYRVNFLGKIVIGYSPTSDYHPTVIPYFRNGARTMASSPSKRKEEFHPVVFFFFFLRSESQRSRVESSFSSDRSNKRHEVKKDGAFKHSSTMLVKRFFGGDEARDEAS